MPKPGELPPEPVHDDPDMTLPGMAPSPAAPTADTQEPDVREVQFQRILQAMIDRRAETPSPRTGLGWTSWVGARPPGKDADDLKLKPSIDAPAGAGGELTH